MMNELQKVAKHLKTENKKVINDFSHKILTDEFLQGFCCAVDIALDSIERETGIDMQGYKTDWYKLYE